MNIWTIYKQPADYPDHYVARRFDIDRKNVIPTDDVITAHSLDILRNKLPKGGIQIPRDKADHPSVVESWI